MSNSRKKKVLSIKELAKEFYDSEQIKKGINDIEIFETWKIITDHKIIQRTNNIFLKNKILFIKLNSSPLRNELENNKKNILHKIKERHPFIKKLYFI